MSVSRRRSGARISAAAAVPVKTEDWAVRWQPITNTATPSADIMSSPDPLNDSVDDSAYFPTSTRRVTRSLRSSRFGSRSVTRSVSPRKQTFELEVGDNSSPQKLLVTVETDDAEPSSVNTRRRLFQSPGSQASVRMHERATTTTVPLRDEDEPTTPRRRGRPRKSNGTPIPGAGVKRRAGTPMKQRTPRRPRSAKATETDDALSEVSNQATPRSTRRGRPPKNKPVEADVDAIPVPSSTATTSTSRGGRRRRQAMDQDELIQMADLAVDNASIEGMVTPEDDEMDLIMAPRQTIETPFDELPPTPAVAQGSDLWLGAGPDEEATPRPRKRTTRSASAASSNARRITRSASAASSAVKRTPKQRALEQPAVQLEPRSPELDDAGFPDLAPAPSDVSSVDDLGAVEPTAHRNDTIAQGEDFSMIFMDSIPSLAASFRRSNNTGAPPEPEPNDHELGEETNLLINKTLETLRQEQESDEDEEADEVADNVDMVEPALEEPVLAQARDASHHVEEEFVLEQDDVAQTAADADEDFPILSSPTPAEAEPQRDFPILSSPATAAERDAAVAQQPSSPSPAAVVEEPEPEDPKQAESEEEQQAPQLRENLSPVRAFSPSLARSPRKFASPLRLQVLKSTARRAEQADASMADQDSINGSPQNAWTRGDAMPNAADDSNMYEDSFSEIPQDVLEAATPRRPAAFAPLQEPQSDEEQGADDMVQDALDDDEMIDDIDLVGQEAFAESIPQIQIEDAQQDLAPVMAPSIVSNASVVSQLEAGRLPTPDDTPPHNNESEPDEEEAAKSAQPSRTSSIQPSPVAATYEEIETFTYTASNRGIAQQPALSIEQPGPAPKVTPMNQLSSPPQDNQSLMPEIPQIRSARPTLSPIVRAGRVLQSVTSDPPSPEGRERQLGSPFRSSASKDSKDSRASRRISMSPPRPFSLPAPRSSSVGAAPAVEDPFRSSSKPATQSGFLQALGRSLTGGMGHRRTISQESLPSSTRHAPPSEQMSWVADEGPISPRLRGDNTLKDVAQTSQKDAELQSVAVPPPHESDEEGDEESEEPQASQQKDDETDIWEFEASRTTPRSTRQQPFGRKPPAPVLKRGTIPSPWARTSTAKAREASPELHTDDRDRAPPSSVQVGSEPDEFSLLAEQRRAEEERAKANQSPSKVGGKFDLSSFFSSPAALPGMLAAKTMSILGARPAQEEPVQSEAIEESSVAERSPSAASVVEPVAAPSPVKKASVLMPTQSLYPKVSQKVFEPSSSPRRDLFSPVRSEQRSPFRSEQREKTPKQANIESPESPEQPSMPIVAQKQNFTPRPRQASQTFFQPSSAAVQPPQSATRTPPRMQLSHEDIANWRKQTTTANSDDNSPGFRRPLLRPLPHKNASPTKSSLRSPLKPHTPGRVVEFTSSVLSPVEQAQARQLARGSILGSSLFDQPPPQPEPHAEDKENREQPQEPSDVSMSDASPLIKQAAPPPLSQTVWTREHWLLLDELLQLRRQGPFHGDYEHSARSEKLLGKTVKSQGEGMRLERWHLDCVDAFRMEVGDGWDEGVLAKRLFALMLGEVRRARGVQEREARVMFH